MSRTIKRPEAFTHALKTLEANRPDQYELFSMRSSSVRIDSKDQKIDSLTRAEDVGLSVRVKKNGRVGFSYTTSLAPQAIEKAVKAALEVALVMPEDPGIELNTFSKIAGTHSAPFDEAGLARPMEDKIQAAMRLEGTCRETDRRVTGVRAASLSEAEYEVHLLNSQGEYRSYANTHYSSSILCKAGDGDEAQMGGDSAFHHEFAMLDIEGTAKRAAGYATELLGARAPKTMACPALIRNGVVADLIDFLGSSFSGEEIEKGRSMLQGKMGTQVFSKKVSIIDDGLLKGGYSARPFDAEGVNSQTTPLVKDGVFQNMLLDTYYGKKFGRASTGNASRGIKAPPTISMTNYYLQAGSKSFEDLVRQVGNGIMITDLMGVHTANPVTGNFSLGASGILIEGGKLTRPVKGFAVAGNVLDLFKNVAEIGSDTRWFGNTGAPSILIPELAVSGE